MKERENAKLLIPEDISLAGGLWDFMLPIVEFLGILVPGIVFLSALFPSLVVPVLALENYLENPSAVLPLPTNILVSALQSSDLLVAVVLLALSYVVGHLFFRRDPKTPDEHSFKQVKHIIGEEGPVRLSKEEKANNQENNLEDKYNLEFPYRYLYEYLNERGLGHLAEMIPWKGTQPKTYPLRTKHFVNLIKVRLEFLFPRQYTRVQRNEAHVRLMSSIWYVTNSLRATSWLGICIVSIAIFGVAAKTNTWWPLPYGYLIIFPTIVLIASSVGQRQIELFLHYQRIREIVFILETAHFANRLMPNIDLLPSSSVGNESL